MDALAVDSRRFGAWADRDYRVSKAIESFGLQFGVHYPHEERPAGRNLRLSPFHEEMRNAGAVMGFAHGWERPNWFAQGAMPPHEDSFRRQPWFEAVTAEINGVTENAGLADLSVFTKIDISGPDTAAMLSQLGANIPPQAGRIGLCHALTPAGGVASEFTITRLAEDHAYLTSAAAAEEHDVDLIRQHAAGFDVTITPLTDAFGVLGLMGPKLRPFCR